MAHPLLLSMALLALAVSYQAKAQQVKAPGRDAHVYQVIVDESLDRLHVRAQFAEDTSSVSLGDSGSVRNIRQLRHCDSDSSLRIRRRTIAANVSCIEYTVLLRNTNNSWQWQRSYADVKDTISSPKNWMMMPPGQTTLYRVSFETPSGVQVSVPWEPTTRKNAFEFRRYSLSSDAITAFGRFDKQIIEVAGAELRVSQLRTRHPSNSEKIIKWLKSAANNVAKVHGKFPLKSTQILIIPVNSKATEPVPFGRVIRDGGEAVQFFVDTELSLESFINDWTATHEFSHLLMPYVGDRWVSEGFASYYQNILMARGGIYSADKAWRKLYEGFRRGQLAAPGRSPRASTMRNGGLMKVYWSAAALALMADVELRKRSDGKESLDTVFKRLRFCCLPSRKIYTDREFFVELDRLSTYPVFVRLFDDYANSAAFPDTSELFEQLGVKIVNGQAKLTDGEEVAIRDAIMQ